MDHRLRLTILLCLLVVASCVPSVRLTSRLLVRDEEADDTAGEGEENLTTKTSTSDVDAGDERTSEDNSEGDSVKTKDEDASTSDEEIEEKSETDTEESTETKADTTDEEADDSDAKAKTTDTSTEENDVDNEESEGESETSVKSKTSKTPDGDEEAAEEVTEKDTEEKDVEEKDTEDKDTEEKGTEEKEDSETESGSDSTSQSSDSDSTEESSDLKVKQKVIPDGPDVDPNGKCASEISTLCVKVQPGDARLVDCISSQLKQKNLGNSDVFISRGCKKEIRTFKINMYKNITMDTKMERACYKDISKFCDDEYLYPEAGAVMACLREAKMNDQLTDACKAEVFRAEADAANDVSLDPQLNELCSNDVEKFCKDVDPGEGRVQDCLRKFRVKLSWDCQAELFRQEVENSDDIRLNVRLFRSCLNDKKKFCPDVIPGDARVKDCLEAHRLEPDFTPQCKEEFDKLMERRASDFRLDSTLRKYCKSDINWLCYPDAEDLTDVASSEANIIECLQDYRDELKDPKCKQQVHQLTKRAAEDIRFDKPLAEACFANRQKYCSDFPNGMAQVFRCLQDKRDKLDEACSSALFDQEVRMAEDIDFKFPMKLACSSEMKTFCKDVPKAGHAAVIKCLQDNIEDAEMSEECKKEVKRDELRSAEDYRLNYRLNKACYNDVQTLCMHACDKRIMNGAITCGGTVLKCLTENMEKIQSKSCKEEVFSFEKLEASDVRMDLPLQNACKDDLAKFCPVDKDHSHTLSCLRNNRDNLTSDCKAEELRFSMMEASDIRLTPTLMNACGQELMSLCKDVPPTGGEAFKCLQSKIEDVSMGANCQAEVNLQEARHSSNYRLDIRLRKDCEQDAELYCKDIDKGKEGHALVLECFVSKFKKLTPSCKTEVSYAVRQALWQYTLGSELTKPCDNNVGVLCSSEEVKPQNGAVIGTFGQCLIGQKPENLDPRCRKLVKVANREGAYAGGSVDEDKLKDTLDKIAELQSFKSKEELILTGWTAYVSMSALVVVVLGVFYGIYRKYYGPLNNYTLVVKGGDV